MWTPRPHFWAKMSDVGVLPVLTFSNCVCILKTGVIKWPLKLLYARFYVFNVFFSKSRKTWPYVFEFLHTFSRTLFAVGRICENGYVAVHALQGQTATVEAKTADSVDQLVDGPRRRIERDAVCELEPRSDGDARRRAGHSAAAAAAAARPPWRQRCARRHPLEPARTRPVIRPHDTIRYQMLTNIKFIKNNQKVLYFWRFDLCQRPSSEEAGTRSSSSGSWRCFNVRSLNKTIKDAE